MGTDFAFCSVLSSVDGLLPARGHLRVLTSWPSVAHANFGPLTHFFCDVIVT